MSWTRSARLLAIDLSSAHVHENSCTWLRLHEGVEREGKLSVDLAFAPRTMLFCGDCKILFAFASLTAAGLSRTVRSGKLEEEDILFTCAMPGTMLDGVAVRSALELASVAAETGVVGAVDAFAGVTN